MSPFWMFNSISLTLTSHQDHSNFNKPSLGTFPDRFGSSFLRIWTEYHYETMSQRVFWKRFIPPHLILASLQIISKINVGSTNRASDFFLTVLGHYFWKYEPSTTMKQCPKVCFFFNCSSLFNTNFPTGISTPRPLKSPNVWHDYGHISGEYRLNIMSKYVEIMVQIPFVRRWIFQILIAGSLMQFLASHCTFKAVVG